MAVPHDGPVPAAGQPTLLATDAELAAHADDTGLHGGGAAVTVHEAAGNPHPTYETAAEALAQIATHEGLANPHPTYETAAEALAQITAFAVSKTGGGKETISTVAASGATRTLDLANGNVHDVTLTAGCTFTFVGATNGLACSMTLILRQGGAGSWMATWPGSVSFPGDVAPTLATAPGEIDTLTFLTLDGGTTWFGFHAGAGETVAPSGAFVGCKVYHAAAEAYLTGVSRLPLLNSDEIDTHAFHFTSAAALTGTVSKTASSPNIVGVGTAFTTELGVNQVISIPGTATEIGVVKTITDDTNLILWQTMANNASGQTATRRNEYVAIPAGKAGKVRIDFGTWADNWAGTGQGLLQYLKNGVILRGGYEQHAAIAGSKTMGSAVVTVAEGDYLNANVVNASTGTVNYGSAASAFLQTNFTLEYLGT